MPTEYSNNAFIMSNINPNPTSNNAEFTITVYEEGNLNVEVYDLAGLYVMDVISNKSMTANTSLQVALNFGILPNGTYTVMVTLGNNNIAKQVIIVK
jgi:hypothetical protein